MPFNERYCPLLHGIAYTPQALDLQGIFDDECNMRQYQTARIIPTRGWSAFADHDGSKRGLSPTTKTQIFDGYAICVYHEMQT
jgi:hypothetical protein